MAGAQAAGPIRRPRPAVGARWRCGRDREPALSAVEAGAARKQERTGMPHCRTWLAHSLHISRTCAAEWRVGGVRRNHSWRREMASQQPGMPAMGIVEVSAHQPDMNRTCAACGERSRTAGAAGADVLGRCTLRAHNSAGRSFAGQGVAASCAGLRIAEGWRRRVRDVAYGFCIMTYGSPSGQGSPRELPETGHTLGTPARGDRTPTASGVVVRGRRGGYDRPWRRAGAAVA